MLRVAALDSSKGRPEAAAYDHAELWYDIVLSRLTILDDSRLFQPILKTAEIQERLRQKSEDFYDLEAPVADLRSRDMSAVFEVYDRLATLNTSVNLLDGMVDVGRAEALVRFRDHAATLYNYLIVALVGLGLSIIVFIAALVR